jgi:hypothetical protein
VHRRGEHLADGMDRVVPTETFGLKTGQRSHNFGLVERELVLDDGVHDGVKACIGQANAGAAMVRLDQRDALALVRLSHAVGSRGRSGSYSSNSSCCLTDGGSAAAARTPL